MSILLSPTHTELAKKAAVLLCARLLVRPRAWVGVVVGTTPLETYKEVARMASEGVVDLSQVTWVILDEFYGPPELERGSHYNFLSTHLFEPAAISPDRIVSPDPTTNDAQEALAAFADAVSQPLDVLFLGLGADGNVGWVFPSNDSGPHIVDISTVSAYFNQGYEQCVTLGWQDLLRSREIIMVGLGANKQDVVCSLVNGGCDLVSARLYREHKKMLLLLDSHAAAKLPVDGVTPLKSIKGFQIVDNNSHITERKVICFSPHPDDTSIGAGATLNFLSESNTCISCACTTGHRAHIPGVDAKDQRIEIREREATAEGEALGCTRTDFLRLPLYDGNSVVSSVDVDIMKAYLKKQKPHIIFSPHTGDAHPTHQAVLRCLLLSLRSLFNSGDLTEVSMWLYEGPWSFFHRKQYNTIVCPPSSCFDAKLTAIRAHKSQVERTAFDEASDALCRLRAAVVPEQDLAVTFGAATHNVGPRIEVFHKTKLRVASDVDEWLKLLDLGEGPPSRQ